MGIDAVLAGLWLLQGSVSLVAGHGPVFLVLNNCWSVDQDFGPPSLSTQDNTELGNTEAKAEVGTPK